MLLQLSRCQHWALLQLTCLHKGVLWVGRRGSRSKDSISLPAASAARGRQRELRPSSGHCGACHLLRIVGRRSHGLLGLCGQAASRRRQRSCGKHCRAGCWRVQLQWYHSRGLLGLCWGWATAPHCRRRLRAAGAACGQCRWWWPSGSGVRVAGRLHVVLRQGAGWGRAEVEGSQLSSRRGAAAAPATCCGNAGRGSRGLLRL